MHDFIFLAAVPDLAVNSIGGVAESAREGFGFNGNILETNILNLSVVVGIVVSFGGDALKALLENRRQTVLSTLEQANQRAKEAKQRLEAAVAQLELAENKSKDIRQQGSSAAEKEKRDLLAQTETDIKRLEESKEETISLQQQKAVAQVSQQVVKLALTRVRDKLASRLDTTFHQSVNSFNIVLFTNYKPI